MIIAVIAFIWIHNNEWANSDVAALDCPQIWPKAIAELAELFGHTNWGRLTTPMKEYMYVYRRSQRSATYAVKEYRVLLSAVKQMANAETSKIGEANFERFAVWKNSSLRIDRYFLGVKQIVSPSHDIYLENMDNKINLYLSLEWNNSKINNNKLCNYYWTIIKCNDPIRNRHPYS